MKTTRRMKPNLKPWMKLNLRKNLNLRMSPSPKLNRWMKPNLNLRMNPSPKLNPWMNPKLNPRKNLRQSLNPKLRLPLSLTPRLAGASFAGCGLCSGLRQGMCL